MYFLYTQCSSNNSKVENLLQPVFTSAVSSPAKMTNVVTPMKNTTQPSTKPPNLPNPSNQPALNPMNLTPQQMLYNQMLFNQMNQQAMMNPLMSQFLLTQMGNLSLMQGQQTGEGLNPSLHNPTMPTLTGVGHASQTLSTQGPPMGQSVPQMGLNMPQMGLFNLPNIGAMNSLGRGSVNPLASASVNPRAATQNTDNTGNVADLQLLPGLLPLLETLSVGRGAGGTTNKDSNSG